MVAVRNKTRGLVGTVGINYPTNLHLALARLDHLALVGDDSDRPSVDARIGRDDGLAIVRFILQERVRVDEAVQQGANRVGFAVNRHALVDQVHGHRGVLCLDAVKAGRRHRSQLIDESAQYANGVVVVLGLVVANPANLSVGIGSAQGLVVDFFANGGLD